MEASAASRTRMQILHGGGGPAGRDRRGPAQRTRRHNMTGSPARRKSSVDQRNARENRMSHYDAGKLPEQQQEDYRESSVGQRGAREHRTGHYSSANSPGRRRAESRGRSKATRPMRVGNSPGRHATGRRSKGRWADAEGSSAVSIPLVEDRPPMTARGRDGRLPPGRDSRTATQSSRLDATRARVERESAQLAHYKATYDKMWAAMETEAAVLVQKNFRGYRGRQLAMQKEARLWKEQEEHNAMLEQLRRQQEERVERVRRAEVQREHMEEQRLIMDQRRRVREEAAAVEREFARFEQAKLAAERQVLDAERQMLSEQKQKLAAAKQAVQQAVRPAAWNDHPPIDAYSHSVASLGHTPSSWERSQYRSVGDLKLDPAHAADTAVGDRAWLPMEGVPPSSPAVESRIASLERQFSHITDVLTSSNQQQSPQQSAVLNSSRPAPQHPLQQLQHEQHEHQLHRQRDKQGTAGKSGLNLYAMPPKSVREPEPERALQPVRAPASTRLHHHQQPRGAQISGFPGDRQLKRQQKEERAAVLLQKTYRGYRGRQSANDYYEQLLLLQQEEDKAATKLQAAWRGSTTRKEIVLMQDESPREKAWALFGGSGRGGQAAAQQAVSPRTQLARRNQFLQAGNSAGGSVLLGKTPQYKMGVESSRASGGGYHSSAGGAGSQTTQSTLTAVDPEDLFADADVAGDGVLVASQVREVLLDMAPVFGWAAPPSDEAFVSDLLNAFGKRYRVADGSLPADEAVVGLDIDAFCAMWEHITGTDKEKFAGAGSDSELSSAQTTDPSFYSEEEEEDEYTLQDFKSQNGPYAEDGAVVMHARENRKVRSVPVRATASTMERAPPRPTLRENDAIVTAPVADPGDTRGSETQDSGLQALIEEGAAISIQAAWRGRRTVNALSELRLMGMTDADIRWMVQQGHHLPR